MESTWPKLLKELLNKDNFPRYVQCEVWASLEWNQCLELRFQLRKESLMLSFKERYSQFMQRWGRHSRTRNTA